jgi:Ca-activated chloride channel family protein
MRFLWSELLWLLLIVPVLIAGYVYALHRRKKSAIRYASLMLVRDALGPRQGWRRHLPPALFLLGLTAAIFAVARPSATVVLPAEFMTVVLAMDVSRSMLVTDVAPNRITGAQTAAKAFIEELPRNIRLGIVSFAGTAQLVQPVTENREDMRAAIDRFQLQRGTATGSGLILALSVLFPNDGIDLESILFEGGYGSYGGYGGWGGGYSGGGKAIDRAKKKAPPKEIRPVPVGSYTGGTIVLLSDGRRTTGPDPVEAAKMAADRGVRVFTVGFGTKEGGSMPGWGGGYSYWMQLDEEALKGVAKRTGGEYFHATNAADLKKVYEHLGTKFALERQETEVSALFSAGAAVLVILAALLSLLWFQRRA